MLETLFVLGSCVFFSQKTRLPKYVSENGVKFFYLQIIFKWVVTTGATCVALSCVMLFQEGPSSSLLTVPLFFFVCLVFVFPVLLALSVICPQHLERFSSPQTLERTCSPTSQFWKPCSQRKTSMK